MAEISELVAYFDGRFIPHNQMVAEMSLGETRAAGGLYDAERTFKGQVFKLREHLQRLYRGLEFANLDPGMPLEKMEAITLQVLDSNRPLLDSGDDFTIGQVVSPVPASASNGSPGVNVLIYCQFMDFSTFAHSYLRGVRVVTPITYGVPPQSAASGSDGPGQETLSLMTDEEGNITECRHANFLFIQDGRIKLPDRKKVLAGISMETAVEIAEALRIPVDEGDYCAHDVYLADEAFVSGTRYCLLPVATLNGVSLGERVPGEVSRRLIEAWSERVGVDFLQQALDHLSTEDRVAPADDG